MHTPAPQEGANQVPGAEAEDACPVGQVGRRAPTEKSQASLPPAAQPGTCSSCHSAMSSTNFRGHEHTKAIFSSKSSTGFPPSAAGTLADITSTNPCEVRPVVATGSPETYTKIIMNIEKDYRLTADQGIQTECPMYGAGTRELSMYSLARPHCRRLFSHCRE